MVGTPVVGVIWLGSCVPCVRFRFNWGVLFPMPLTEKPSAPADSQARKTNAIRQLGEYSLLLLHNTWRKFILALVLMQFKSYTLLYSDNTTDEKAAKCDCRTNKKKKKKNLLCGPYKLAPSCDSWPDDDGEGEDSIWEKRKKKKTDQSKTRKHPLWSADMVNGLTSLSDRCGNIDGWL